MKHPGHPSLASQVTLHRGEEGLGHSLTYSAHTVFLGSSKLINKTNIILTYKIKALSIPPKTHERPQEHRHFQTPSRYHPRWRFPHENCSQREASSIPCSWQRTCSPTSTRTAVPVFQETPCCSRHHFPVAGFTGPTASRTGSCTCCLRRVLDNPDHAGARPHSQRHINPGKPQPTPRSDPGTQLSGDLLGGQFPLLPPFPSPPRAEANPIPAQDAAPGGAGREEGHQEGVLQAPKQPLLILFPKEHLPPTNSSQIPKSI